MTSASAMLACLVLWEQFGYLLPAVGVEDVELKHDLVQVEREHEEKDDWLDSDDLRAAARSQATLAAELPPRAARSAGVAAKRRMDVSRLRQSGSAGRASRQASEEGIASLVAVGHGEQLFAMN